jgi:hypothetical protein
VRMARRCCSREAPTGPGPPAELVPVYDKRLAAFVSQIARAQFSQKREPSFPPRLLGFDPGLLLGDHALHELGAFL